MTTIGVVISHAAAVAALQRINLVFWLLVIITRWIFATALLLARRVVVFVALITIITATTPISSFNVRTIWAIGWMWCLSPVRIAAVTTATTSIPWVGSCSSLSLWLDECDDGWYGFFFDEVDVLATLDWNVRISSASLLKMANHEVYYFLGFSFFRTMRRNSTCPWDHHRWLCLYECIQGHLEGVFRVWIDIEVSFKDSARLISKETLMFLRASITAL